VPKPLIWALHYTKGALLNKEGGNPKWRG